MTLIELLVSLTIGLFLTWGAFEVYVQSKSNFRAADAQTRLQENARFALETLEPDLRLAGSWGRNREAGRVTGAAAIAVTCGGVDASAWALDFAAPVAARDDSYDLDCAPLDTARADSDVLLVRRADSRIADPTPGTVQLRSDLTLTAVFADGVNPAGFPDTAETRDLVVHAYYVDNASSFDATLPSLRRKTLVPGGVLQDEEMITGVENLQVQFGLDTDGDGSVERYVDPDSPVLDPAAAAFLPDARVMAVRLWLLVRGEEAPGGGFRDTGSYQPLDLELGAITPGSDLYPDEFQRVAITRTVLLRNQGGG
jgi:type IV pilus assembly protein PilW